MRHRHAKYVVSKSSKYESNRNCCAFLCGILRYQASSFVAYIVVSDYGRAISELCRVDLADYALSAQAVLAA